MFFRWKRWSQLALLQEKATREPQGSEAGTDVWPGNTVWWATRQNGCTRWEIQKCQDDQRRSKS